MILRKILPLLMSVLLITIMLSGCDMVAYYIDSGRMTVPTTTPTDPPVKPIPLDAPFAQGWCFTRLNDDLQHDYAAVYEAVETALEAEDSSVLVDGVSYTGVRVELPVSLLGRDDVHLLYRAVTTDNPQFFFLSNRYSYEGYTRDEVDYYTAISLTFNMKRAQRIAAKAALDNAVEEIFSQLPPGSGDYDTELYCHDALLERCTYQDAITSDADPATNYPQAFTAYGALVEGIAGCEGYSRAMQLLLLRRGNACTLVTGTAQSEGHAPQGHMWNLVRIEGRGYHLDATWNDDDELPRHAYFNLTTEEIERTHQIDDRGANIGIDTCTSTGANFYHREGLYLDTYDPNDIAAVFAHGIMQGWAIIDVRFPAEKFGRAQSLVTDPKRLASYINPLLPKGTSFWARYITYADDVHGTITLRQSAAK